MPASGRLSPVALAVACLALAGAPLAAQEHTQAVFPAGVYRVSSPPGTAIIHSVSGLGTAEAPLVVTQHLTGIAPTTLIVRFDDPRFARPATAYEGNFLNIAMTLVTVNRSGRAWVGFDFELQQLPAVPSVYEDGLSFDQMRVMRSRPIGSDRFAEAVRDLEPYDQVRFLDGGVDPGGSVRFDLNIIDVTPNGVFYLKQSPRLPAS